MTTYFHRERIPRALAQDELALKSVIENAKQELRRLAGRPLGRVLVRLSEEVWHYETVNGEIQVVMGPGPFVMLTVEEW